MQLEGSCHCGSVKFAGEAADPVPFMRCHFSDPTWPELVHPHASAIDTPLPKAPQSVRIMLGSCARWVEPEVRKGDRCFEGYPDMSLAQWHEQRALVASPRWPLARGAAGSATETDCPEQATKVGRLGRVDRGQARGRPHLPWLLRLPGCRHRMA